MARPAVLSVASVALLLAASSARAAPGALPKLPGDGAGAAKAAGPESQGSDAARRGVVQVEKGGRPIAIGAVLAKDGRVLTSLSALGKTTQPTIRYADGTVVKTKLGHKDASWDLALLVPQSGHWRDGLVPTRGDPSSSELRAFLPKGRKLSPAAVLYKGRVDARSKDGTTLRAVHAFDFKGTHAVAGAPVLDATSHVVGILVHACKGEPKDDASAKPASGKASAAKKGQGPQEHACSPMMVGAPVYALRSFLMKTPASAVQPSPWLGLGGAPSTSGSVRGVQIMGVAPGSPAEKAGLKPGGDSPEIIVAVDGQPVETPSKLAEVIAKSGVGQEVKLLVFSGGKFREVAVTLQATPPSR